MIPDATEALQKTFKNSKLGSRVEDEIEKAISRGDPKTRIKITSSNAHKIRRVIDCLENKGYVVSHNRSSVEKLEHGNYLEISWDIE